MNVLIRVVLLSAGVSTAAEPSAQTPVEPVAVSTSPAAPRSRKEPKDIVWPEPPEKPRIQFVRSIRTRYDVKGRRPGLWARLAAFFSGEDMRRPVVDGPFGVWVQGDLVYLTDPVGQKVVRLDLARGEVKEITEVGRPIGVAAAPSGEIFVTDTQDNAVLAFGADGKLLWKTDVMGTVAGAFKRPTGIAWIKSGEILVNDSGNGRIVVLSKEGKYQRALCRNREKDVGALPNPTGLWAEPGGGFLVTDPLMGRVHVFTSTGAFVTGFGELGDSAGYLARPRGVASDSDGNVYVADALFNRVQIFNRAGDLELYFGGPGIAWGKFVMPAGLFVDAKDRIYVVDSGNSRLEILQYLKAAPDAAPAPPKTP